VLAEIVLIPSESKKLISLAILELPEVKNAFKHGIVALHPSSTTVFLYKEILGQWPRGLGKRGYRLAAAQRAIRQVSRSSSLLRKGE
jgi:hypothetical protein